MSFLKASLRNHIDCLHVLNSEPKNVLFSDWNFLTESKCFPGLLKYSEFKLQKNVENKKVKLML